MSDARTIDVLLLHMTKDACVAYVKDLLGSVGLSVESWIEQGSGGRTQNDQVDHAIASCSIPIVVVSFDSENPANTGSRPNIYDELQRCHKAKPDRLIVLREERAGQTADIPSNLLGHFAEIVFRMDAIADLAPRLLRECRSKGLFPRSSRTGVPTGTILNSFLDRMNDIWDNELDGAWNAISGDDYPAERSITEAHDRFHQEYLHAFEAAVRRGEDGDVLRQTCDGAIARSLECAADAWRHAAQSKLNRLRTRMKAGTREDRHKASRLIDKAQSTLRKGAKSRAWAERMRLFKESIQMVDQAVLLVSGGD
jgi:hypothetical protein